MKVFLPLAFLLLLVACDSEPSAEVKAKPVDASASIDIETVRFDEKLDTLIWKVAAGEDCRLWYQKEIAKHRRILAHWLWGGMPGFDANYLEFQIDSLVTKHPENADHDLALMVCRWTSHKDTRDLLDSTKKYLPKDFDLAKRLTPALSNLRKHFPKQILPKAKIGAIVMGYDVRRKLIDTYPKDELMTAVLDNKLYIMIGLDYFMGDEFPIIHPQLKQSKFFMKRFRNQYMEQRVVGGLISNFIHPASLMLPKGGSEAAKTEPTLLAQMLYSGIQNYILLQTVPNLKAKDLFYWEAKDWAYAEQYEAYIYKKLLGLLYETQSFKFNDFLDPRPQVNVRGLPPNGPSAMAHYIGLKIIQAYMQQHPNTKLSDLVKRGDWQKLLRESGYKPVVNQQ